MNSIMKKVLIYFLFIGIGALLMFFINKDGRNGEKSVIVDPGTISKYEIGKPKFGDYSRAVDSARPTRYIYDGKFFVNPDSEQTNTARIMCAGDLMCEPVMSRSVYKNDKFFFELCFSKVKKVFEASDFAIANLETSVDPNSPYAIDKHKLEDRYHCNAPEEYLDAIKYAGLDAVTMANNHTADTGVAGLLTTITNVEKRGLIHTGAFATNDEPRYFIVDINGIKVAFLSYTQHINSDLDKKCFSAEGRNVMLNLYSKEKAEKDVRHAKAAGAEFVICYIHFWCKDYVHEEVDSQINCAKELAEAGVDCIVGSHPHAVQKYDEIVLANGKTVPVTYCLGNFITSDSNISTRSSYIFELFLAKDKNGNVSIVDKKIIPCCTVEFMEKSGFVVFPTPSDWRDGIDNEVLQHAENEIKEYVGGKISIDYNH